MLAPARVGCGSITIIKRGESFVSKTPTKYVFVTGGVLSGVGKGITAASMAKVLKSRGLRVNIQKCDPYLNTDAGTLNPAEHGEVFVTADGAETDLDLGHYERFLDQELDQSSSLMSGRILRRVIDDERVGKYLGKTVQIIPHVTGAIQEEIERAGEGYDVHFVEIGGTVGDYEGLSFLEAIREFKQRVGADNVLYAHVVYLPYISASNEIKTKPAQNAVRSLRGIGISPDVIVARSEVEADSEIKHKISMYADVEDEAISIVPTVENVYEIPLLLEEFTETVASKLDIKLKQPDLRSWRRLVRTAQDDTMPRLRIGIVAKYMAHDDTYMSVFEAIKAAAWAQQRQAEIVWIDAEKLESRFNARQFQQVDAVVVPGGFGTRGIEGKIKAAGYAAQKGLPYLGLCLGLQVAVVAVARQHVHRRAHTVEYDANTPHPVISLLADQESVRDMGGTMRLGNYPCRLQPDTLARRLYSRANIQERHRHRYEVNNSYREQLQAAGLTLSGQSPDGTLVEMVELDAHPFFIASQFHPEFNSRPERPHPLFVGLIKAAQQQSQQRSVQMSAERVS